MAASEKRVEGKRKRRFRPEIPSATPSNPEVTSQAPRGINVSEYAEARALEIHNMVQALVTADSGSSKRIFQSLPRHMRRRAVSHNVKRLPVRLRETGKKEMEKAGGSSDKEKKSRRNRRKPKNLMSDYSRRQKKHIWLETHLWHAKRMKMIDVWGYRLALHPNDKSVRAAHRAVKSSCLLQDVSYMGCIEVSGQQIEIITAMSHVTSQDTGLTMAAKSFLNGCREGRVILYRSGRYPYGAIGPVRFLWRQAAHSPDIQSDLGESVVNVKRPRLDANCVETARKSSSRELESHLWIWAHPACFQEVFDSVVDACQSVGATAVFRDTRSEGQPVSREVSDDGESKEECSRNIPDVDDANKTDHIELNKGDSATETMLTVASRRFKLLRLRLRGPESHALLVATLKLADIVEYDKSGDELETRTSDKYSPRWWRRAKTARNSQEQVELWNTLVGASSPSVLPPGCAVALTVLDPRLDLPGKKTSVHAAVQSVSLPVTSKDFMDESVDQLNGVDCTELRRSATSLMYVLSQWPSACAVSPIWEEQIRCEVKETKIPEQELNQRRSQFLIPGSKMDLGEDTARIPILLLQQPGCPAKDSRHGVPTGYASGWDIIIPSGWAMAFWMALVYRGARTGGLREAHTCTQEQGVPFFPDDWPDTPAGVRYDKEIKEEGGAKYSRYPPAKRPNYNKLGVKSPFSASWAELANDCNPCNVSQVTNDCLSRPVESNPQDAGAGADIQTQVTRVERDGRFYVLRSKSKLESLRNLVAAHRKNRPRATKSRKEQHRIVSSESTNAQMMTVVKQDGRSLVCVSLRMLNRSTPLPNAMLAIPSCEDLDRLVKCESFAGPVEPLHKGSKAQIVNETFFIGSCSRQMIGFVTSGQFSLAIGCGFAVGYCSLPGLTKLLSMESRNKEVLVLVRNTTTQQYRFACLEIV